MNYDQSSNCKYQFNVTTFVENDAVYKQQLCDIQPCSKDGRLRATEIQTISLNN